MLSALVPAAALGLGVLFASPMAVAPTVIALPPGHLVVPISGAVDLSAQANRTRSLGDRIGALEAQLAEQARIRADLTRQLEERGREISERSATWEARAAELERMQGMVAALQARLDAEAAENQKLRDVINARDNRNNRALPRSPAVTVPRAAGPDDTPPPTAAPRSRVVVEPL